MTDDRPHRFTDDELRGVVADDDLSSIVTLDDFAQDLARDLLETRRERDEAQARLAQLTRDACAAMDAPPYPREALRCEVGHAGHWARVVLGGDRSRRAVDALATAVLQRGAALNQARGYVAIEDADRLASAILERPERMRVVDELARHVLRWEPVVEAACAIVDYGRGERHPGHAAGCGDVDVSPYVLDVLGPIVDEARKP